VPEGGVSLLFGVVTGCGCCTTSLAVQKRETQQHWNSKMPWNFSKPQMRVCVCVSFPPALVYTGMCTLYVRMTVKLSTFCSGKA
jgi:hypothetical protein